MDIVRKSNGFTIKQSKKLRKKIKVPLFKYISKKTQTRIKDENTLKRINSLRIPPAYKKVEISTKKSSKIQAIGEDDKGRKQYIYSKQHLETQENVKFKDLIIFGKYVDKIRRDVSKSIKEASQTLQKDKSKNIMDLERNSIIAIVIFLIDNCHFRVGCEKYKKLYKTYGVTTLNKSHVKTNALGKLIIEFIGKKGVLNKSVVKDKNVCKLIKLLCDKSGNNYIFRYGSDKIHISERHVNGFLKSYEPKIKVKMFRTWNANMILLSKILSYPIPETSKESKKNLGEIIEQAAFQLHHTKSVSKSSYMNNKILDLYENDIDTFKTILRQVKKKHGGKMPQLSKILLELIIYLDKK